MNIINFWKTSKLEGNFANRNEMVTPGGNFMELYSFKHPMKSLLYLGKKFIVGGSIGMSATGEGFMPFFFRVEAS